MRKKMMMKKREKKVQLIIRFELYIKEMKLGLIIYNNYMQKQLFYIYQLYLSP